MVENFFKKLGEDAKKNYAKFQADVNNLFGVKPKQGEQPSSPATADATTTKPSPTHKSEPILQTESKDSSKDVTEFIQTRKGFFENLQQQWSSGFTEFNSKMQTQNAKNLGQLQAVNQKMKAFFDDQNKRMTDSFAALEQDLRQKSVQSREAFFGVMNKAADNWNNFIANSQHQFEHNLNELNKMGWKAQIRFILYLLPILVIVALIFTLLRPIIMPTS